MRRPPLTACGPFLPQAVFSRTLTPDFPLERFAGGELGVVQSTWAKSYLFVAYRYLSGRPLDLAEQQAALALWKERLNPSAEPYPSEAVAAWLKARGPIAPAPERIYVFRSMDKYYFQYLNCPGDAFRTATRTLAGRIQRFGASSPEVRDWVTAQDQVFGNCSGPQRLIPAARPVDPDRAYQIASAHFYAGDFPEAEKMFRAIAADAASPWRRLAPYLVARTLIRRATLSGEQADRAVLAQAEAQLQGILEDPAARRMLDFVRCRLHPEERLRELSAAVGNKVSKQDLSDYTMQLDRVKGSDEMSDWILTVQGAERHHALERWQQTSSALWLVAAILKAPAGHAQTAAVLAAAARLPPGSPAFLSAAYHRVRLLIELGRQEEARRALEAVPESVTPSARNLFAGQRLRLARNFDEFLRCAPRVPAGIIYDVETGPEDLAADRAWAGGRMRLDADSARVFNYRLPVRLLQQAVKGTILPAHLRIELAQAAWARAALLEEAEVARDLAAVVATERPGLKAGLDAYLAAGNAASRQFAAVFVMLQFPGSRPFLDTGVSRQTPVEKIDNYRDNWWCNSSELRDPLPPFPGFLDEPQREAARSEWEKLQALGAGPNYLARRAVEWAGNHPDDPRSPEALHLGVRSTRYGCTDKETSRWSRAAFELLHKRYPKSPWAAKTRYWF